MNQDAKTQSISHAAYTAIAACLPVLVSLSIISDGTASAILTAASSLLSFAALIWASHRSGKRYETKGKHAA